MSKKCYPTEFVGGGRNSLIFRPFGSIGTLYPIVLLFALIAIFFSGDVGKVFTNSLFIKFITHPSEGCTLILLLTLALVLIFMESYLRLKGKMAKLL